MNCTTLRAPTSRVRWGLARADITPPVGIYHGFWGAARHDRATGVHRPLYGDVLAVGPVNEASPALVWALLDLTTLPSAVHAELSQTLSQAAGLPAQRTVVSVSHTHASGWFFPDRLSLPGGELIPGYLADLRFRLERAAGEAVASMQEADITYALGRCNMAANRDCRDETTGASVCGLNPGAPADDTVVVARVVDRAGNRLAVLVNYACHPTTLAFENTEISPDYVGAMREEVTRLAGVPCVFVQGASGDLAPRYDYVGGREVADRNGRWLAYAALAALESMGPPAADYHYREPVISGATLGVWEHAPLTAERLDGASRVEGGAWPVHLTLRPRPDAADVERELALWSARRDEALARGDALAARDCGAHAERARRGLARFAALPADPTAPYRCTVYRVGDAAWVMCGGEPYSLLQTELRRRFPDRVILVCGVSGGPLGGYLPPRERYGQGLYQEEVCLVAPGSLEKLIDSIAGRIGTLYATG